MEIPKAVPHILILCVLVFALLFLLVNFGYLRCCDMPGFCSVYYAIKGTPKVALVSGTDGTGDPEALHSLLASEARIFAIKIPAEYITDTAVLDPYQVILVEHAKTMSTQTLRAFQQYVQKGGRLVWIGDAGTGLGPNDYVCEKVKISYVLGAYAQDPQNKTIEQCGEWVDVELNVPEEVGGGICDKTFGAIVKKFLAENKTLYESLVSGDTHICQNKTDYYKITGAERIMACLDKLARAGKDAWTMSADDIEKNCPVYNYWNRGPSKTATGGKVDAIDFSALVLGFDYVTHIKESNLLIQVLDPNHDLVRGYRTSIQYTGVSNVTLVDTSRFAGLPRTSTLMAIKPSIPANIKEWVTAESWPAVIISNPLLQPFGKRGLIIYYAFPIDDLARGGAGFRFINNLFDYTFC